LLASVVPLSPGVVTRKGITTRVRENDSCREEREEEEEEEKGRDPDVPGFGAMACFLR
jgi:hypothetical protein